MSRYLVWRRTALWTLTGHPLTEWRVESESTERGDVRAPCHSPLSALHSPLGWLLVLRERVLGRLRQLVERLLRRPAVHHHPRHRRDQRLAVVELGVGLRWLARVA